MSFELHMIDVGQGESIVLDLPDGSFGLIDAGPDRRATKVLGFLNDRLQSTRRFRFAAATQWDADHIAGFPAILERRAPEEFMLPGLQLDLLERLHAKLTRTKFAALSAQLREGLHRANVPQARVWARSMCLDLQPDGVMFALGPSTTVEDELVDRLQSGSNVDIEDLRRLRNRASLVLWLQVFGRGFFLPGEIEANQYPEALVQFTRRIGDSVRSRDPRCTWLKMSHHGARYNNPVELFQFFAASDFVGSASAGGRYGHPHPLALKTLHFDSGGRAMCTRLGQGCSLIHQHSHDASSPASWLPPNLGAQPNPKTPCYGTVSVKVLSTGECNFMGSSSQQNCPFGGPTSLPHAL